MSAEADNPARKAAAAGSAADAPRKRTVRADGQRNRERLLKSAKEMFAESGPQVSLEAIARAAGVGIGTLYRHFPTRDALIEAVCRRAAENLAEAATELLASHTPGNALHEWMRLFVDYVATKKIMASVVNAIFGISAELYRTSAAQITDNVVFGTNTEVFRSSTAQLTAAVFLLTESAVASGEIRKEAHPMDIFRAIAGFTITYGDDTEGWEASALRLVDIFMDGLKAGAGTDGRAHSATA